MKKLVDVVLVGIGGYGEVYLNVLLDEPEGAACRIVGAVDPEPGNCSRLAEIEEMGIPIHSSMEAFYRDHSADLSVISSPIHLHAEHVCLSLDHGSHVLVEKPAAATTSDVEQMIEARDRAGRFVAVGFQWSFARSILDLKRDILAGRFGAPLSGHALTLWPRTESYYNRNNWAGKKQDPAGRWILDSPASNAMAHFLHNMLFLLGPETDRSAEPVDIETRIARVNEIETFDTVATRICTQAGTDLRFLASHTISEDEALDPCFRLEFEKGTITFPGQMEPITARSESGDLTKHPPPDATSQVEKLWMCVKAVTDGSPLPCGLETSLPHTSFVQSIEESGVEPHAFPNEFLRSSETAGGRLRWVEGLADALKTSYEGGDWPRLPGASD